MQTHQSVAADSRPKSKSKTSTSYPYVLLVDQESGAGEREDPLPWGPGGKGHHYPFLPIPNGGDRLSSGYFEMYGKSDEVSDPDNFSSPKFDGKFFTAMVMQESMEPKYPVGRFVLFQETSERAPAHGDFVYATILTKSLPFQSRSRKKAGKKAVKGAVSRHEYINSIRQYLVTKKGNVVLKPLRDYAPAWRAGIHNGVETRVRILGVALPIMPKGIQVASVYF